MSPVGGDDTVAKLQKKRMKEDMMVAEDSAALKHTPLDDPPQEQMLEITRNSYGSCVCTNTTNQSLFQVYISHCVWSYRRRT
jgi:hypothetical protein